MTPDAIITHVKRENHVGVYNRVYRLEFCDHLGIPDGRVETDVLLAVRPELGLLFRRLGWVDFLSLSDVEPIGPAMFDSQSLYHPDHEPIRTMRVR